MELEFIAKMSIISLCLRNIKKVACVPFVLLILYVILYGKTVKALSLIAKTLCPKFMSTSSFVVLTWLSYSFVVYTEKWQKWSFLGVSPYKNTRNYIVRG